MAVHLRQQVFDEAALLRVEVGEFAQQGPAAQQGGVVLHHPPRGGVAGGGAAVAFAQPQVMAVQIAQPGRLDVGQKLQPRPQREGRQIMRNQRALSRH